MSVFKDAGKTRHLDAAGNRQQLGLVGATLDCQRVLELRQEFQVYSNERRDAAELRQEFHVLLLTSERISLLKE